MANRSALKSPSRLMRGRPWPPSFNAYTRRTGGAKNEVTACVFAIMTGSSGRGAKLIIRQTAGRGERIL